MDRSPSPLYNRYYDCYMFNRHGTVLFGYILDTGYSAVLRTSNFREQELPALGKFYSVRIRENSTPDNKHTAVHEIIDFKLIDFDVFTTIFRNHVETTTVATVTEYSNKYECYTLWNKTFGVFHDINNCMREINPQPGTRVKFVFMIKEDPNNKYLNILIPIRILDVEKISENETQRKNEIKKINGWVYRSCNSFYYVWTLYANREFKIRKDSHSNRLNLMGKWIEGEVYEGESNIMNYEIIRSVLKRKIEKNLFLFYTNLEFKMVLSNGGNLYHSDTFGDVYDSHGIGRKCGYENLIAWVGFHFDNGMYKYNIEEVVRVKRDRTPLRRMSKDSRMNSEQELNMARSLWRNSNETCASGYSSIAENCFAGNPSIPSRNEFQGSSNACGSRSYQEIPQDAYSTPNNQRHGSDDYYISRDLNRKHGSNDNCSQKKCMNCKNMMRLIKDFISSVSVRREMKLHNADQFDYLNELINNYEINNLK